MNKDEILNEMPYIHLLLVKVWTHVWPIPPLAVGSGLTYAAWTIASELALPDLVHVVMLTLAVVLNVGTGSARALVRHFQRLERWNKLKALDGMIAKPIGIGFAALIVTLMSNTWTPLNWIQPAFFVAFTVKEGLSALVNLGFGELALGLLVAIKKALPESWHFLLPRGEKWTQRDTDVNQPR